jgi:hypothetical protein
MKTEENSMRGYSIKINIEDKPEDIRFRLYDNNELVVDDIGVLDFQYLTEEGYTGTHQLTMTYFQTFDTSEESNPQTIYVRDFTMPNLEYTTDVSLIS